MQSRSSLPKSVLEDRIASFDDYELTYPRTEGFHAIKLPYGQRNLPEILAFGTPETLKQMLTMSDSPPVDEFGMDLDGDEPSPAVASNKPAVSFEHEHFQCSRDPSTVFDWLSHGDAPAKQRIVGASTGGGARASIAPPPSSQATAAAPAPQRPSIHKVRCLYIYIW